MIKVVFLANHGCSDYLENDKEVLNSNCDSISLMRQFSSGKDIEIQLRRTGLISGYCTFYLYTRKFALG
ncbi:hypothetical protein CWI39_3365p0010 [Hamiltosporidium magnivora]|uniref:Uncharacterized protein n=1 Tax=Hamiltosporidium magnivora TaxID=148818 RepID=A0A4V2JTM8_9MICR|nr:hypothetical protein CWI39_3365p0010 [Hamiltosporidium magnivora]